MFIPFMDGILAYDCKKCAGCCCKYGTLALTDKESLKFFEEKPLLKYFANSYGGNLKSISRHSSCWFFDKSGLCKIEKEFGIQKKPLFCRAFPFKVVKCRNVFLIHVATICPTLTVKNRSSKRHRLIVNNAAEVITTGIVRKIKISKKRLVLEKRIFNCSKKYFNCPCYFDFVIAQKYISDTMSIKSVKSELDRRICFWLSFLKLDHLIFDNKKITRELTAITSIIRMLVWRTNKLVAPDILAAIYIFMLIYDLSKKHPKDATPVYSYVSMMDIACGLAKLRNNNKTKKLLVEFIKSLGLKVSVKKLSFLQLADRHIPSVEQRMIFVRQIGLSFQIADDSLLF